MLLFFFNTSASKCTQMCTFSGTPPTFKKDMLAMDDQIGTSMHTYILRANTYFEDNDTFHAHSWIKGLYLPEKCTHLCTFVDSALSYPDIHVKDIKCFREHTVTNY